MSWSKFSLGFILVVLCTFAKSQITDYWVPIEFSGYLIFMIIRKSQVTRALVMTFVLSIGMDFIFQASQVKGLEAMGQLLLVYVVVNLKKQVVPQYEDLFLLVFFGIYYLSGYYISLGLGKILGIYVQEIIAANIVFYALVHTTVFGGLLMLVNKLERGQR